MAHQNQLSAEGGVVVVYGEITDGELAEINHELCSSSYFDEMPYCVKNLIGITKLSVTLEGLTVAAWVNAATKSYKRNFKMAFVVSTVETARLVKHYIDESVLAGSTWKQLIFTDMPTALRWAKN